MIRFYLIKALYNLLYFLKLSSKRIIILKDNKIIMWREIRKGIFVREI